MNELESPEYLRWLHQVHGMTPREIADLLGCGHRAVRKALTRFSIGPPSEHMMTRSGMLEYWKFYPDLNTMEEKTGVPRRKIERRAFVMGLPDHRKFK